MANEGGRTEVKVPDLGDFEDVDVIDVLVAVGDDIEVETPLVTLETDKATMDVPSTVAGRVVELTIAKGDKVSAGSTLLIVESGSQTGGAPPAEGAASAAEAPTPERPAEQGKAAVSDEAARPTKDGGSALEAVEMRVPDLGDFADVEVIDVLVAVGDQIATDSPLVTLETEKATMDVPATAGGKVLELRVAKGDRVSKGDVILTLAPTDGAQPASAAPAPPAREDKPTESPAPPSRPAAPSAPRRSEPGRTSLPEIDEPGFARAHASPSVRKFARELGVDLSRIKGSGAKGRITQDDVKAWVKQWLAAGPEGRAETTLPRVPEIDFAKFGPVEVQPLGRIQRISGPRLHASWVNVPHVWQLDTADITEVEAKRKELKDDAAAQGVKLTPLAFIVRAVVKTLAEFPRFNASLDPSGQTLILKKYLHVGFAADTPKGLVVPVIRDADRKDIYELARDLAALSEKARDGKLSPAEMQGGCFTISSLGGIGGTAFTPIINAPEVAILGVSRSSMQPVFVDGEFVPRLILPYSLAYDHRVIDGADAARFTTRLAALLGDAAGLFAAVP